VNVATVSGHRQHNYTVVDLTKDSETHQYNGRWLQEHPVGIAWRDADYRISFAKNKTHIYDYYTLNLKNIYGVTPKQDKMYYYHALEEWYGVTFDILNCFPVHFGIIDAFWSADGILGFKGTTKPKHTKIVVASKSIMAADMVGAEMMGRDPRDSLLMRMYQEKEGVPSIERVSNVPEDYVHEGWENIDLYNKVEDKEGFNDLFVDKWITGMINEGIPGFVGWLLQVVSTFFEESYLAITIGGLVTGRMASDYMDTKEFPMKPLNEIIAHVSDRSMKNLADLFLNAEQHKDLQWQIGQIWRSIRNLLLGRPIYGTVEKTKNRLEAARKDKAQLSP